MLILYMDYQLDKINNYFKLPIEYLDKKEKINDTIKDDLELISSDKNKSIYSHVFESDDIYGQNTIELWSNYYTHDKLFLKDSQKLFKHFKKQSDSSLFESWDTIKKETSFLEKYNYIDISFFNSLNKNSFFLQIISIYQFVSPIFALLYPIIIAIVPYLFLKLQGIPITISQYFQFIKMFLYNSSFYQLFSSFSVSTIRQKIYALFSIGFYLFGVYQNIISCISFYYNMHRINNYIVELSSYIHNTVKQIDNFIYYTKDLKSYSPFIENAFSHRKILDNFYNNINNVTPYSWNYHNLSHMGVSLKHFYTLYFDESIHESMMYSFGFLGYIQNISDIQYNIESKYINFVKFSNKTSFKKSYYPVFKKSNHVKNSYNISKKMIISGPNASGKTTLLKSTLFNIILSQQIGAGFFKSGTIKIYNHIHCYLNIPDTSDRDSLFQAEARRCKEIINSLHNNKGNHFCIFDELYSGTNPYEAIASAYSFINYLHKYNMDFMLTTHYVELCENLDKKSFISNKHMSIDDSNNNIKYLYKLENGISKYKGGVQVLKNLDYPKELISNTIKYLNK